MNSMNQSMMRRSVVAALTLACFLVLPHVSAVNPPPEGGYANFTTAEGQNALKNLTTGAANTGIGWFSLFSNTEGSFNTAAGAGALLFNSADENTAFGVAALLFNTAGSDNTALGTAALLNNTTGDGNTACGTSALQQNTTGASNTAIGNGALASNTTGNANTASGLGALLSNTTGRNNTATGEGALIDNNSDDNTATGASALFSNTTGNINTANGSQALLSNTLGVGNTANGVNALEMNENGSFNTAVGVAALVSNTSGNANIALGWSAGSNLTTGDDNIDIGNTGVAGESNTVRIGDSGSQTRTFIAGIRGATTGNMDAIAVVIDSAGQLGTVSSSRRFKKEIKPMENISEAILALKPVTFQYNADKTNTAQFGLIAEQVAEVNPDLVVRDEKGEIYTVRYDAVNAMLLNEFLKEHHKVEQLEKQVERLASGLQKLSAQLELNKAAPQTAGNDN